MLIHDLHDAFAKEKIDYVIVGGYALAFHDLVRNTVDIDLVLKLDLESFEKAERALKSIGLQSRIPIRAKDVIQFRKEYIENKNLIAWSFVDYKDPMRQVDILITTDIKRSLGFCFVDLIFSFGIHDERRIKHKERYAYAKQENHHGWLPDCGADLLPNL